ncbi:MAG TPA: response regulator [Opitutaceae bacterium]|nr:response regulator [Opitutaceae bacterium]
MFAGRKETHHRILIVDDDPDSLFLTQNVLAHRISPCEFSTCNSAEAALQYFDRGQTFDVIVTDQTMARMDGVSLVRALRARGVSTPIIVTSLRPDIRDRALAAGASHFVDPSRRDDLVSAVRHALHQGTDDYPPLSCRDHHSPGEID